MYWCYQFALDVFCDINVKKSSSTSETGASSDEFAESLVAAARDCCCCWILFTSNSNPSRLCSGSLIQAVLNFGWTMADATGSAVVMYWLKQLSMPAFTLITSGLQYWTELFCRSSCIFPSQPWLLIQGMPCRPSFHTDGYLKLEQGVSLQWRIRQQKSLLLVETMARQACQTQHSAHRLLDHQSTTINRTDCLPVNYLQCKSRFCTFW